MWVAFAMTGGCPWGTAAVVLGIRARGEFGQCRPKDLAMLATIAVKCP